MTPRETSDLTGPSQRIDADIAVLGSGAAGLVAALVAADAGAEVVVIERSPLFGGTTAVSGGAVWIPCNHLMAQAGYSDTPEDALRYLRRITLGAVDDERLVRLIEAGPEAVHYLTKETPVELQAMGFPDYHTQLPGARPGGRTLDVLPFETSVHPGVADIVRRGVHYPAMTQEEARRWRANVDRELIADRVRRDVRTMGAGLAAGLVAAARDRGVRLVANARARQLIVEHARVTGAEIDTATGGTTVYGRHGVVVTTGGFEWNEQLTRAYLRGPMLAPLSPPWNEGDGLLMGLAVGAAVGGMSEAWWTPALSIPGERYDGRPMSRMLYSPLPLPGSVVVNRHGRRFMDEALNYHDQGRAFHAIASAEAEYVNMPAWLIFDSRFKRIYPVAGIAPGIAAPAWFRHGDTLESLAAEIDVDPAGLLATVDRFNAAAARGEDPEFHRGFSEHDRFHGDPERGNLAPLSEGPFYALNILPGAFGTKGGLSTDLDGRVLGHDGNVIPGLFAAGNAAVSPMGPGYPGAGGTLGPAIVTGFLAGRDSSNG